MRRSVVVTLILLAVLGAAAWWGGPQLWAWYHLRAGQSALEKYHSEEARGHLDACLRVWPDSAAARLLAARAARRLGDYDAAREHLNRCQDSRQPARPEVTLEGVLLRVAKGELGADVEEYLQSRVEKDPALAPLIWEAQAVGYARMYRILEAVNLLDHWLELQPDNVQAWYLRGELWSAAKVPQKAAEAYQRVLELDPERHDARWWLALCLMDVGRHSEALSHLEALRPRRPGDPELRVRLARCHNALGQMQQARQLLDEVLAEDPGNGLALRTRGEVEMMAGRLDRAEPSLREAARVQPYSYQTQYLLYQVLRQLGKEKEAKEQLEVAQSLKDRTERLSELSTHKLPVRPHDPQLHYEMGTLLISLGQPDLGERWLLSALHENANFKPAHAALADLYEKRGDGDKAAEHRQQAGAAASPAPPPP
jgi:tetratricopeptide (TPR) repeat protein